MGRVSADIDNTCKLYVGVIEKEIHFTSAPGSNGEKDFYSVMKKLLPSSSGLTLGQLKAGDYFAYSFTWELANVYNNDQLSAVAWVQDPTTKEVHQACRAAESIVPFYANEAGVDNVSNLKSMICSGVAEPTFEVGNYGSNTLTAATFEVYVNDELLKTINWTGSLGIFEKAIVEVGEISFPVLDDNTLEVRIVDVNGTTDEASNNDIASATFEGTPNIAGKTLKLSIRTDENPEETTWEIRSLTTGETVLTGGPYDAPRTNYTITLELPGDDCYDFTIYDAGGNGFDGGLYGLKAGSSTLFSGSVFGASESNEFFYELNVGLGESDADAFSVYPNPTTGNVSIFCEGEQTVSVYNMAGQRVLVATGSDLVQIDLKPFGSGVYAVQVGGQTQRVVVR